MIGKLIFHEIIKMEVFFKISLGLLIKVILLFLIY